MAIADGFNPEGGTRNYSFSTYDSHSELCDAIHLSRRIKAGHWSRPKHKTQQNLLGSVKEKPPEGGQSWWLLDSDQRSIMHPVYSRAPSTTQANYQAR